MPLTSPRVQALLAALCVFRLLPHGFTNRDLRNHLAPLLGLDARAMTSGQLSYDLRRLRIHGLIERIPHTFRYQVTPAGIRQALFLTRLTQRLLIPGLAQLTDPSPPAPSRLRAAARAYDAALDDLARQARTRRLTSAPTTSRNDPPPPNLTHQEQDHRLKPSTLRPGLRPGGVAPFGGSAADVLT